MIQLILTTKPKKEREENKVCLMTYMRINGREEAQYDRLTRIGHALISV